jgi:putative tricarboxylic transport membrane protein
MDILSSLAAGFQTALQPATLMYCFLGVFLGTFIGVLPGIGSLAAVAMLLPITFYLDPTHALIMLAGVYYGSEYGGSTASILLNLPGTPNTAVTCLDGYPMTQQGRGGVALLMTTIASFVGGTIGILIMMLFSPVIAGVALQFGAAEYFAMMVLGLVAASTISQGSAVKGIAMVVLGIMLGIVGTDVNTGLTRFTFQIPELYDGIALVAIAMGLFGISEVIASVKQVKTGQVQSKDITFRSMIPTRDDVRRSILPMLRGSAVGSFFGALPGTGGTIASFMAYAIEKKVSRSPERFGRGAVEGITAPESSNNAADQTAFIPTLTLGIPGNVIMALMLGALMIHGITPGPNFIIEKPDMFWGLIMSFWIGNLMLLVLNIPMIGIWIRVLAVPYHLLYPAVLMFVCMGVYSVNNSAFDVQMVLLFGLLGYAMRLLDFSPAPLILGFVLGPLMEENLRRALLISRGDFMVFLERPISAGLVVTTGLLLLWTFWSAWRPRRRQEATQPAE